MLHDTPITKSCLVINKKITIIYVLLSPEITKSYKIIHLSSDMDCSDTFVLRSRVFKLSYIMWTLYYHKPVCFNIFGKHLLKNHGHHFWHVLVATQGCCVIVFTSDVVFKTTPDMNTKMTQQPWKCFASQKLFHPKLVWFPCVIPGTILRRWVGRWFLRTATFLWQSLRQNPAAVAISPLKPSCTA